MTHEPRAVVQCRTGNFYHKKKTLSVIRAQQFWHAFIEIRASKIYVRLLTGQNHDKVTFDAYAGV